MKPTSQLSKKVKVGDFLISKFSYTKFSRKHRIIKLLPCKNGYVKVFYITNPYVIID